MVTLGCIYLRGIVIPWPNSFFDPISPSAEAAPVGNAGATFETPRIARGSSLAPRDAREVNRFPQCFTDRLICVRLIFISDPVPAASDFLILAICLRVSINSSEPWRFECFNRRVSGDLFRIAEANFDFCRLLVLHRIQYKLTFDFINYIITRFSCNTIAYIV